MAMQRRGTNVVVGGDRQKLGAKELDLTAVVKRNKKQITAVLVSLTVFAVLLSKCSSNLYGSQPSACLCSSAKQVWQQHLLCLAFGILIMPAAGQNCMPLCYQAVSKSLFVCFESSVIR